MLLHLKQLCLMCFIRVPWWIHNGISCRTLAAWHGSAKCTMGKVPLRSKSQPTHPPGG
jgi:hypothetical protein